MATCLFRSPLAPRLQAFWESHYARSRRGISSQKILLYLDRFLMGELQPGQTISRQVVERWNDSMAHLSPNTRINRLCVLRRFCRYLHYFDPDTCLIHSSFTPRRTRRAPHIYSRQEVQRIMAAARQLGPPGSLRPVVVTNLIGLLYSTGIRIGEALNLTLRDIDLRRRVIEVREGKFRKSRYVPLSSSTARQMKKYLRRRREAGFSTAPTAPVFLNIIGTRHGHPGFVTLFLELLRRLDRASTTCVTPSRCIASWRGIGRVPICRPNCRCSQPIWATAPSPALKSISKPRRNSWKVPGGAFMSILPFR